MISNPDKVDVSAPIASNATDQRHILAIAQDLIYATTHGLAKTPKHIGLAKSVRHVTGSKFVVTMLSRFSHCCSYDDIEVVDTSLVLDIQAMMDVLHQKHSVITFNLAINRNTKEIQWRRPEEFKNIVIRWEVFT